MITEPLSDSNFVIVAMHHYDNPQCTTIQEFEEDLKRFIYLKKLFNRYTENGDLKEKLIINHIIVLFNLFGIATVEMLFLKVGKEHWNNLATFLSHLQRLPAAIPEIGMRSTDFVLNQEILNKLKYI